MDEERYCVVQLDVPFGGGLPHQSCSCPLSLSEALAQVVRLRQVVQTTYGEAYVLQDFPHGTGFRAHNPEDRYGLDTLVYLEGETEQACLSCKG